ncbi:hypothetical protein [Methanocalculus sp.]|uniref:hypothetical protein n=1 Tax=Methanocalculus sp. TaxID=2004547 RepID=UPI00272C2324|nr:hypothetical protein [Methanocalculus sp.]
MACKTTIYLVNHSTTLLDIVDEILDYANEDEHRLAGALASLDPAIRSELLISDLLNAYQVYIYAFREVPSEMIIDRLLLEPASSLVKGAFLEEIELSELFFMIEGETPAVQIRCGSDIIATMKGKGAHKAARQYALEHV